jgi:hypothetical protein
MKKEDFFFLGKLESFFFSYHFFITPFPLHFKDDF